VSAVEQERDDLAARLAEAKTQLGDVRQQFVEISSVLRERDDAVARVEAVQRKGNEMQRQLDGLTRERNDAVKGREENARLAREAAQQLDETQRQLAAIRGARDAAQAMNLELNQRLQTLRDDIVSLSDDRDFTKDSADKLAQETSALRERLEHQTKSLADAERDALQRQIDELARESEALKQIDQRRVSQIDESTKLIDELKQQFAEATKGLSELQSRHDELASQHSLAQAESERLRGEGSGRSGELEAQLTAAREQLATAEQRVQAAQAEAEKARVQRDAVADKAEQAESQRLCAIDLAAQLENAKRELISMAANLAEARLQIKLNQPKVARPAQPVPVPAAPANSFSSPPPFGVLAKEPGAAMVPLEGGSSEPLTEKEARSILSAIRQCHQSFVRDASDLSLLNELHCHVHFLSERARTSSFVALERFTAALSLLAQELYRFPEQANCSAMRTLEQAIELLAVLLRQPDYRAIKDPSNARVFAVDDDMENCDAIRMALETVALRTHATQEPVIALSELASQRFDLILLDVELPHMDGFELCQHIRQMPAYSSTPIVFLTGLTTIENRVQSSLSGGSDFVGKPFNLQELGVKALTLMLKASLNMN
jgi:CheY-like chemotaxis protein